MNANYRIRALLPEEIDAAMALIWEVFSEFEAPDYSGEGVAEFREYIRPVSIRGLMEQGELTLWGCFDDGAMVGVIAVRAPFHIALLFVQKKYHRQGIARDLFDAVLTEYGRPSNCGAITVNSSPYAVEAYRHLGFADTGGEQTVNGLRFVPMRRPL